MSREIDASFNSRLPGKVATIHGDKWIYLRKRFAPLVFHVKHANPGVGLWGQGEPPGIARSLITRSGRFPTNFH